MHTENKSSLFEPLPGTSGLFVRPKPVKSGQPFKQRVVVSHRSDNLLKEQIENVQNVQDALKEALSELEKAKSAEEVKFLQQQVTELKNKSDQMVIVLKIVNKINIELAHARAELAKTVKEGDSDEINRARKRVGWLEDKMEQVLGKKRQRSAHRAASLVDDPRNMLTAGQRNEGGYMSDLSSMARSRERPGAGGGRDLGQRSDHSSSFGQSPMFRAGVQSELSDIKLPPRVEDVQAGIDEDESKPVTREQRRKKKRHRHSPSESEEQIGDGFGDQYQGQEKTFLTQYPNTPYSDRSGFSPELPSTASPQKTRHHTHMLLDEDEVEDDSGMRSATRSAQRRADSLDPHSPLPPIQHFHSKQDTESTESTKQGSVEQAVEPALQSSHSSSEQLVERQKKEEEGEEDEEEDEDEEGEEEDEGEDEEQDEIVTLGEKDVPVLDLQNLEPQIDAVDAYWQSDHHRFEYSEFVDDICGQNPTSYHIMGLAARGTFVKTPPDTGTDLPWRSRDERSGSEISDVHKKALDKLSVKVHKMYGKVKEASMLSVRPENTDPKKGGGMSLAQHLERMKLQTNTVKLLDDPQDSNLTVDEDQVDTHSDGQVSVREKPTLARFGLNRPDSKASDCDFPKVDPDIERLATSLSGRIIYRPKPLPYPDKLPLTKVECNDSRSDCHSDSIEYDFSMNKSLEYPPLPKVYSHSQPSVVQPAERIVDQRNLYNETKFTSSLFAGRGRRGTEETRREEALRNAAARRAEAQRTGKAGKSRKTPSSKSTATAKSEDSVSPNKTVMIRAFSTVRAAVRFKAGKWKDMKPKSGALKHTGMKWERVKSIVHNNLISPNTEERVDAARHLGSLRVGDTMVVYALRERLKHDEEPRVAYEAAKALGTIGAWDEDVMDVFLHYFLNGNTHIRADLLKTIIFSKNVQYIDKTIKGFDELALILSTLCRTSDDAEDQMSFNAAVCLGRLCIPDENARDRLKKIIDCSINSHMKAEALDILVRQLNYNSPDVVPVVLQQLSKSAVWKYRVDAAKLLVHLGMRYAMPSEALEEQVYEQLERRLWDEPNQMVRHEAAKALAALELFPQACERVEKKLDDHDEALRAQAVISAGTLGMKNERILRHLLEMIDLDSSDYVRLMIIRSFATLNCLEKRVLRILKDKEKGDGPLARESRRTLEHLDAYAQLLELKRKRRARKQAMMLASVA